MEARSFTPSWGVMTLCAVIVLNHSSFGTAQVAGPFVGGQQIMMAPGHALGHPMGHTMGQVLPGGPMQPVVQGMPARGPAGLGGSVAMAAQAGSTGGNAPGHSENFIVFCRDPKLTAEVSRAAEKYRRELAMYWLGYELPTWSRRCPIEVTAGPRLGAGGETRFMLYNGNVGDWQMSVQGTPERIIDSVLPHEITHTILASHFAPLNTHVPRWADEGACTTVEHESEQSKHKALLIDFMRTGRAMSFNRMFSLKDYPKDILTLYAEGHSVVEFLIAQGGPREFVKFLEDGMKSGQWEPSVRSHYGYETLGQLQSQWNAWIAAGRGKVDQYAGRKNRESTELLASNRIESPARPAGALAKGNQASDQDVVLVSGTSDSLLAAMEGQSVSLESIARPALSNIPSGRSVPALVPSSSGAGTANEMNLIASNSSPNATSSTLPPSEANDGFYRQRLESNMRAKFRAHAAPSVANSAQPMPSQQVSGQQVSGQPAYATSASAQPTVAQATPGETAGVLLDAANRSAAPLVR